MRCFGLENILVLMWNYCLKCSSSSLFLIKARVECLDPLLYRGTHYYLHQLLGNSKVQLLLWNIFQSIHIWKYILPVKRKRLLNLCKPNVAAYS